MTENELKDLIDDLPDDDVDPFYEIYLYGYDADDVYTGYKKYLTVFHNQEDAEKFLAEYELTELPEDPVVYVRAEIELKLEPGPDAGVLYTVNSRVIICK